MSTAMQHIAKSSVERAAKNVAASVYIELMNDEEYFVKLAQSAIEAGVNVEQALAADMRGMLTK